MQLTLMQLLNQINQQPQIIIMKRKLNWFHVLLEHPHTIPTPMVNKLYANSKPVSKEAVNPRVHSGT